MKIVIIGAGITGLSAAWLLSQRHEVVLIEKEPRLGGHSNTVDVAGREGTVPVDTGFIVYNTACYPNLIALFDHLGVATAPTDMSFSVSLDGGAFEYNGNGLGGLFGQPSNLFRPSHWRMAWDILRFFGEADALRLKSTASDISLGDWLEQRGYSQAFIERHIVPMGAAIWSTPAKELLDFPAAAFARFFANHGLLQVSNRPQWRTVKGGSREYVASLKAGMRARIIEGDGAVSVSRSQGGSTITLQSGEQVRADRCLLACHGDTALALLADADDSERSLLAAFHYARNEAVLHRDASFMPQRRRLWTSWNYIGGEDREHLSVTYWMNLLQPLGAAAPELFVTLNPYRPIDEGLIEQRFVYHHPMFDEHAMRAQTDLWSLQGRRGTWFAGSYFGYGFHEDGLQSGLAAAEDMGGVRRPWAVDNESGRIHVSPRPSEAMPMEAAQ